MAPLLVGCQAACLANLLWITVVGSSARWLDVWLAGWRGGWVVGLLDGPMAGWLSGWMDGCINLRLTGWPTGWLAGWLGWVAVCPLAQRTKGVMRTQVRASVEFWSSSTSSVGAWHLAIQLITKDIFFLSMIFIQVYKRYTPYIQNFFLYVCALLYDFYRNLFV